MCMEYDESMTDNPFFQEIQKNYQNLIRKATKENWIFCIPQRGTIYDHNFNVNDIFEHVLVPYPKFKNNCYRTLTNKNVHIENKYIHINRSPFESKNVKILFEETFYVSRQEKYTIWCINNPLHYFHNVEIHIDGKKINTLQDCINLLSKYCVVTDILKLIEKECNKILVLHKHLETESLQNLRNSTKELFITVLNKIMKFVNVDEIGASSTTLNNFKVSVETYMQFIIYKRHFSAICNATACMDNSLNKIIRNNFHLECKDLNIDSSLHDYISSAKLQLNKINNFHTILDKVNCLKSSFQFYKHKNVVNNTKILSADDFINIAVFIIIKSNVYNWVGNVTYITQFICNNFYSFNENSFFVTTLEAAVQHIQNRGIFVLKNEIIKSELINSTNNKLELLYRYIKSNNFMEFKGLFATIVLKTAVENNQQLCHPLCSCESCENVLKDEINIDSTNEKGCTLLHIASYYGRLQIAEELIQKGANVNCLDFMNNSPLHYASSRGNQDILLLLLHARSEVNLKDYNGNTPLHLASYNGHENCVKALLYSTIQKKKIVDVNYQNNSGDTALHLASKLGFIEIVGILLQYGSDPNIKNHKNLDAIELAHNYYVKQMIILTKLHEVVNIVQHTSNNNVIKFENNDQTDKNVKKSVINDINTKSYKQMKKVELVLKAIENNDTPLMCYHLGIPSSQTIALQQTIITEECHPLCLCEKCQTNGDIDPAKSFSPVPNAIHVNICNTGGYTPLHIATKYGRSEMVRLLLDSGSSVNAKTFKHQFTSLHIACLYQRVNCVRELLKSGACNVDIQDAKGNTPLHCAVSVNNARIVEILLGAGANVTLKNIYDKTSQQEANERMLLKILGLFKNRFEKLVNDCELPFEI